jgi:hypothetical protein
VFKICRYVGAGKHIEWCGSRLQVWRGVEHVVCDAYGVRPKVSVDSLWPPCVCVIENSASMILQLTDPALCYSILKMRVNSTET